MKDLANKNRIRSPFLFVGLFFLINPYMATLDFLPDFFGYLLIWYALSDLAKLEYRTESACRNAVYLALLSFARAVAFVLSVSSDESMRLLLTFSFGVAEILLVIRFAADLFGGTEYLLQRYDGFDALSKLTNVKFLTLFFFIAKVVLGCIPEAAVLLVQKVLYSDVIDIADIPIYNEIASYRPYAVMLFMLITFILGVWWFIEICRYFSAVRMDESFISSTSEAVRKMEYTPSQDENKLLTRSYATMFIGAALYIDIYIDRVNVLPTCLGTLIMAFALISAEKRFKKKLVPFAACASALQLAFDVCYKIFGSSDAARDESFSALNVTALAVTGAACAVASVLFVRGVRSALTELHSAYGCTGTELTRLKYAENLYTAYALMNIGAFALPTLQPWLMIPRMAAVILFVFFLLNAYWNICDERVSKLDLKIREEE